MMDIATTIMPFESSVDILIVCHFRLTDASTASETVPTVATDASATSDPASTDKGAASGTVSSADNVESIDIK